MIGLEAPVRELESRLFGGSQRRTGRVREEPDSGHYGNIDANDPKETPAALLRQLSIS